jgi:hypothetical protein
LTMRLELTRLAVVYLLLILVSVPTSINPVSDNQFQRALLFYDRSILNNHRSLHCTTLGSSKDISVTTSVREIAEILRLILANTKYKDLQNARRVCKSLHNVIGDAESGPKG